MIPNFLSVTRTCGPADWVLRSPKRPSIGHYRFAFQGSRLAPERRHSGDTALIHRQQTRTSVSCTLISGCCESSKACLGKGRTMATSEGTQTTNRPAERKDCSWPTDAHGGFGVAHTANPRPAASLAEALVLFDSSSRMADLRARCRAAMCSVKRDGGANTAADKKSICEKEALWIMSH